MANAKDLPNEALANPHPTFRSKGLDMMWWAVGLVMFSTITNIAVSCSNGANINENRGVGVENRIVTCMSLKLHDFKLPEPCFDPLVVKAMNKEP